MSLDEDGKAKNEIRGETQKAGIVPRSLRSGPPTARASGRDENIEDSYAETTESAEFAEKRNPRAQSLRGSLRSSGPAGQMGVIVPQERTLERPASEGRALQRQEEPKTQTQNPWLGHPR